MYKYCKIDLECKIQFISTKEETYNCSHEKNFLILFYCMDKLITKNNTSKS